MSAGSRSKSIAGGSSVSVEAALSWHIRLRTVCQLGQSPGCPPALTVARPAGPLMRNCSCTCSRPSPSLYTLQTRGVSVRNVGSVRNAACVGWCSRGSAHPSASYLYTTHKHTRWATRSKCSGQQGQAAVAAAGVSGRHLWGMRCRAARFWLSEPYAEMGVPAGRGSTGKVGQ